MAIRFVRLIVCVTFLCVFALHGRALAADPSLHGTVADANGVPLADAVVTVRPGGRSAHSDASGRFEISGIAAGTYQVVVARAGYVTATYDPVTVGANGAALDAQLNVATLTTLQQIASVRAQEYGTFNASASSLQNLTQQNFIDQGQLQLGHVLDQVPGVVSARPGSANAAAPGSITSPNLRGTLDYEKSTLIDGFPLINGSHGDYPIMYLNSLLFSDVEVARGPTAFAPEINYGIGGTLNFRTGNPTPTFTGQALFGVDAQNGSFANLRVSDTYDRLGFYFNLASYGTQGPLQNYPTYITPNAGWSLGNYGTFAGPVTSSKNPDPKYVKGWPSNQFTSLVACCQSVTSNYLTKGEVGKLQYHFSPATVLTAGFIGIQGSYDGAASGLTQYGSVFAPASGYSTSAFAAGQAVTVNNSATLPGRTAIDNEPMFEAELRTTLGNDTLLARYYNAILDRRTIGGLTLPTSNYTIPVTVWGSASFCTAAAPCTPGAPTPPPTALNGVHTSLTIPTPYFQQVEHDVLHGLSFEYDHLAGDNLYTVAVDTNTGLTNAYTITGSSTAPGGKYSTSIAAGTKQIFVTYLARATFNLGTKAQLTLANYLNTYSSTYTTSGAVNGVFPFATTVTGHDDPRLGLSYRASGDLNLRFNAGSGIAPPYPSLIDNIATTPAQVYTPTATTLTITQNSGALRPETSWSYDGGADWRVGGGVFSGDVYLMNIWNQFVGVVYPTSQTYKTLPVYISTNANLAQSRYEGIEATYTKDPHVGWGYTAAFDLQRAYAYNVSPGFYTSAAGPYSTNLGVVNGINYQAFNAPFFNGVSNKSEAYSMGYAGFHHRTAFGQYVEFGMTYYGSNNTYNVPAFFVGSATIRQPIDAATSIQISSDNLFNSNAQKYVVYGNGIPAPLANGGIGIRQGIPYGPATLRVSAVRKL